MKLLESDFNHAVRELDEADDDVGTGRHTSTRILLLDYAGHQDRMHYEKDWEAIGVLLGCIDTAMGLGAELADNLCLSNVWAQLLLNGREGPFQTWQMDLEQADV